MTSARKIDGFILFVDISQ